jgi:hypothetical protein
MKYKITWEWDYNSYSKELLFGLNCKLFGHKSIESFDILIREENGERNYCFVITTILDQTDCKEKDLHNYKGTVAIKNQVCSKFKKHQLKLASEPSTNNLRLPNATKHSTIDCTRVLFKLIDLSTEDQSNILGFLEKNMLSRQPILDILGEHILKKESSKVWSKAISLEKHGYNGILLKVAKLLRSNENNVKTNMEILNNLLKNSVSLEVIEYLLTLQIDWTYINDDGSPLIHTAFNFSPAAIPSMIEKGADINQIDKNGYTLMHIVAYEQVNNWQITKLKILFDNKANPTLRAPNSNMTPYQLAYMSQNPIIAQWIANYTTNYFEGSIGPENTIAAQFKQIIACQEREKPQSQIEKEKILAQLQELEQEKAQLQAKLNQQPISVGDYDPQDYALIKPMLDHCTDKIAEFPAQASQLLSKVCVSFTKTKEQIDLIIKNAFEGSTISDEDKKELSAELEEINTFATTNRKQLNLRSQVEYKADDIANMVREAAKDLVLEKQAPKAPSVVTLLQRTNSPLHRPSTTNSANYTEMRTNFKNC